MSEGNESPQPEGNGVRGHPLLTSSHRDKQPLNIWTPLFRTGQVFYEGP